MKVIQVVFFALIIFSCKSSRMGTSKIGSDGQVIGGKTKLRCTYPAKRYARGLDAKVKLNIDSLSVVPVKELEASLTTTVVKLSDYTSEGLDRDLLLFRICEMANNRNMSADQTETLIDKATAQWEYNEELKKKSDSLKPTTFIGNRRSKKKNQGRLPLPT